MENQVPIPPQPNTQHPINQRKVSSKMFFFFSLAVVLVIVAAVAGYAIAGNSKNNKEVAVAVPSPTNIPTPTTIVYTDNGIAIEDNTVSFARESDKIYLRYKNNIYEQEESASSSPTIAAASAKKTLTWYGLVNAPETEGNFDEVFSFRQIPNSQNFLFVMRWDIPASKSAKTYWDLEAFNYDITKDSKLSNILSFKTGSASAYSIPRIDQISSDGKYVSFNLSQCWNCGGHKPETFVLNLTSNQSKNIGKTSNFTWKENGSFEYKDYKTTPCPTPEDLVEYMAGECPEDPTKLPLKTGKI